MSSSSSNNSLASNSQTVLLRLFANCKPMAIANKGQTQLQSPQAFTIPLLSCSLITSGQNFIRTRFT
eukprot:1153946-Pelagomonas_calceolata.AAC.3